MNLLKRIGLAALSALALLTAGPALASLSQGYAVTAPIATGSLVALDPKSSGTVVVADLNNAPRLFGVVVAPSSASISLSSATDGQVQVATSGTAQVLVSTGGGDIHTGDYITISSIAGVGQKVGPSSSRVVGIAQSDFTSTTPGSEKRSIDDGSGKHEVTLGQIPVAISVSSYTSTDGKQPYVLPTWLQNFSNALAGGKAVPPVRIIIAGLVLIVAVISVSVLLYSAVRNSIISIGRNPLSRSSVVKSMLTVGLICLAILGVSAGAMYLVITR